MTNTCALIQDSLWVHLLTPRQSIPAFLSSPKKWNDEVSPRKSSLHILLSLTTVIEKVQALSYQGKIWKVDTRGLFSCIIPTVSGTLLKKANLIQLFHWWKYRVNIFVRACDSTFSFPMWKIQEEISGINLWVIVATSFCHLPSQIAKSIKSWFLEIWETP